MISPEFFRRVVQSDTFKGAVEVVVIFCAAQAIDILTSFPGLQEDLNRYSTKGLPVSRIGLAEGYFLTSLEPLPEGLFVSRIEAERGPQLDSIIEAQQAKFYR